MPTHNDPSPLNAVPPAIMALAVTVFAIECLFQLGARGMIGGPEAVGWRLAALQDFGFSNRAFAWMVENGRVRGDFLIRLVTYPFIHANMMHALFGAVMMLALGKFVGERMNQWAVLVLFFGASIGGAVALGLAFPDGPGLFGAFPGVYGLIGGFTYLVWLQLGQMGANQMRAFSLIGILLAVQLVFGVLFGGSRDWLADVVGFAVGFGLSFVLVPGGWQRLRGRLQRR